MTKNQALWKQARLKLVQGMFDLMKIQPASIKSLRIGGSSIHLTDAQATKVLQLIKKETEAI